jgi:hypothetical protein
MVPAVILIALMPLVALPMVTFNRLVRHFGGRASDGMAGSWAPAPVL